ncbi:hypothetical protein BDK51DRAFT_41689 [Blyttiomyces helicus]|uniref:Uncharacterized protein n=1 Tax=Blyttiomyces helicus TaxID=388810 RepID=A0A4P9WDK5_9FUNG|nr:hypothetical protein BDK51DRAFT_41689 [Blyttiomyces helicus]|eukprot:RKO90634.1 hypothetical protein BDK51DRAFT_41689 [Blyttiomyces helicus]
MSHPADAPNLLYSAVHPEGFWKRSKRKFQENPALPAVTPATNADPMFSLLALSAMLFTVYGLGRMLKSIYRKDATGFQASQRLRLSSTAPEKTRSSGPSSSSSSSLTGGQAATVSVFFAGMWWQHQQGQKAKKLDPWDVPPAPEGDAPKSA